jgi:hypothetical protein
MVLRHAPSLRYARSYQRRRYKPYYGTHDIVSKFYQCDPTWVCRTNTYNCMNFVCRTKTPDGIAQSIS